MHIGISGPVATKDIAHLLDGGGLDLPVGYEGAPLVATLIAGFLRRGHSVSMFTLSRDLPLKRGSTVVATGPGLTVHYVPMRPRAWPFNGLRPGRIVDLYAFERHGLVRAIRQAGPEVVHAHWAYEFAWAALDSGLPHVVTCHDSPVVIARYYNGQGLRFSAYRWLKAAMAWNVLRRASLVTTVSPYMVGQIQSMSRVPVQVIPNPIPDLALSLSRRTGDAGRRILMVCNGWSSHKNPEAALLAFSTLSRRLADVELVIAGAGFGPGEAAEQWWSARGLAGRVVFRGPMAHGEVLSLMAESDVLLHPSLEESFGAVLAEAMAIGLPVVAGKCSGAVPWVVGAAGVLVDVKRPEDMADALYGLLTDSQDAIRRSENGRSEARARFSLEAVNVAYEDVFWVAANGATV